MDRRTLHVDGQVGRYPRSIGPSLCYIPAFHLHPYCLAVPTRSCISPVIGTVAPRGPGLKPVSLHKSSGQVTSRRHSPAWSREHIDGAIGGGRSCNARELGGAIVAGAAIPPGHGKGAAPRVIELGRTREHSSGCVMSVQRGRELTRSRTITWGAPGSAEKRDWNER